MRTFQAIFLIFLATSAWGQAGFKVRVNPAGMNFIREFIEEQATGYTLETFVIEYIAGFGIVSHETDFVGLTISHFNIDKVFVDQTAPSEITIRVTNSTLKMNGGYDIDFLLSPNKPDIQLGTLDFDFGQVTADISFSINVDENFTTSLEVKQCFIDLVDDFITVNASEIVSTQAAYHKLVLNKLLYEDFGGIEKSITGQFCNQLVEPVVNQLNQLLSSSQGGSFVVVPGLLLNASLYESPVINSTMIEVELDGTFYPASQPNLTFPYPRPALPPFKNSPSMVQGALSVRVLQTLLYSLVQTDAINMQIPVQSLSLGSINVGTIFGLLIPTFSNFVNGRPLSLRVILPEVPSVQLTTGAAALNGTLGLAVYAVNADGSSDHAATFTMDLQMAGNLAIVDTRLKVTITGFSFHVGILDNPPAGQASNLAFVNSFLSQGNLNILPTINGFLNSAAAIQIPSLLGYSLENVNLKIVNDAILMSLDIYKVEVGYIDFDGDTVTSGTQSFDSQTSGSQLFGSY